MDGVLALAGANLLSPIILSFALGFGAAIAAAASNNSETVPRPKRQKCDLTIIFLYLKIHIFVCALTFKRIKGSFYFFSERASEKSLFSLAISSSWAFSASRI